MRSALRKNRIKLTLLGMLSAVLVLLFAIGPRVQAEKPLVIYDVHSDGPRILKDDGSVDFADYVRIRNNTSFPYDLTGLFLSDSAKKYDKLPLDGIVIEPGDSVMIKLDPSWNFGLRREGDEDVYLSDSEGNTLYKYMGRMKPKPPVLSAASGFYDDEFELKLSAKGDHDIYYTLDGREPDESSQLYTSPIRVYDRSKEPNSFVNIPNLVVNYNDDVIGEEDGEPEFYKVIDEPVDKAFIIRAVAVDRMGNKSDIVNGEYFFCKDKYQRVLSVVADTDDLFGPDGIAVTGKKYDEWYQGDREGESPSVNFREKGREWEIPANMDYFINGVIVLDQKCGLRLQGRTTRNVRLKNFQLRARNCYSGSEVFEYDFFDNEPYRCDAIGLDDSFRESVFYTLVEDEEIIKPKTTGSVALFINGEFWETVYIRQRINEKYFADHYNIDPDNMFVLNESFPDWGIISEGELEWYRGLYLNIDELAEHSDMTDETNIHTISSMMDMDSYIDYLAINTWIGCNDWGEYENDQYWRVKEVYDNGYGDGRFRWNLHDGDNVFNKDVQIFNPYFLKSGPLFPGLMNSSLFREKFSRRLEELGRTCFSDENIRRVLESDKWNGIKREELETIEDFMLNRKYSIDDVIREIREKAE